MTKGIVYCSGPLFCPAEIAGMGAIARVLEDAGYGTFLPHRDGLEYYLMKHANSPLSGLPFAQSASSRAVFALDVYQIVERCEHGAQLLREMHVPVPHPLSGDRPQTRVPVDCLP